MKVPLSLRIRKDLRDEIEKIAASERRSVSNVAELIIERGLSALPVREQSDGIPLSRRQDGAR